MTETQGVYQALFDMQQEIPTIPKSKTATLPKFSYKYADLGVIRQLVDPLLVKHNLLMTQPTTVIDGLPYLKTLLVHLPSGTVIESLYPLPDSAILNRDPQDGGTAITYARRYTLCTLLGIVADEDNDAANLRKDQHSVRPNATDSEPRRNVRPGYDSNAPYTAPTDLDPFGEPARRPSPPPRPPAGRPRG